MKADHYQSAAAITAALISERATFGERTTRDEAVKLYVELVMTLDRSVKEAARTPTTGG